VIPSAHEPDDESLARRAREGDSPSFEALVIRHHPRLVRYAAQRLRDTHAAEDVAQAAFVSAWKALHQWNPERPLPALALRRLPQPSDRPRPPRPAAGG
jgi:DNA-directed RNA polymerase specialized sigma24 family protein